MIDILLDDKKTIDRVKLGKLVFSNDVIRKKLNSLTHMWIGKEIMKEIWKNYSFFNNDKVIVLDSPLLLETKVFYYFCTVCVVVVTTDENQLNWLLKRNKELTKEDALNRIKCQMPQKEKIKYANFVINNDKTIDELKLKVKKMLDMVKNGKKSFE